MWIAFYCRVLAIAMAVDTVTGASLEELQTTVQQLSWQSIMDRFYLDEMTRSNGGSGVKQSRVNIYGPKTYLSETYTSKLGPCASHDHANNKYTVGMGEFIAVLNGVEFRTRHNDYAMKQRTADGGVDYIPLPNVPADVLAQPDVAGQIEEMRQYFRAFKEQDETIRDYKPYFKANLCYLEGAWIRATEDIIEPFASDRHFINANTWKELIDKIRFNAYSGSKEASENLAFLPTKIVDLVNSTEPKIAQWNYKILCQPLQGDLPLDRFRVVDDIDSRLNEKVSYADYQNRRRSRFQLNNKITGNFRDAIQPSYGNLVDLFMNQVPGYDGPEQDLIDRANGIDAYYPDSDTVLNAAFYHRLYEAKENDANNQRRRVRGYSDPNMFVAMTAQEDVEGMEQRFNCDETTGNCDTVYQRFSYAIPLEIIYTTPLSNWNPYGFEYHTDNSVPTAGGRNGASPENALNGISRQSYYQTPSEFFSGNNTEFDPADTSGEKLSVLDPSGFPRSVRASGHYIKLPEIADVGSVRQRYSIVPVNGEGSLYQKELDAIKEIMLNPDTYSYMYHEQPVGVSASAVVPYHGLYKLPPSSEEEGSHTHLLMIVEAHFDRLKDGYPITVNTEVIKDHTHTMKILGSVDKEGNFHIVIHVCDEESIQCPDGHTGFLIPV